MANRPPKALMIQGAGSNVGKSMLVAGLARVFAQDGLRVAPFKPQNMSNNAAVTVDGGEIGRAQALQARAAGCAPHTDMNPVLLKPETDTGSQVIVQGKRFATLRAKEYGSRKAELMGPVLESYKRLAKAHDLILVEGAGSPAEINLREGDIANMGFAEAAGVPVVLIGDIDRGGVIAQLVGTHKVLTHGDEARITGFAINKFRGDTSLFAEGAKAITEHTGWPNLGIVPWFSDAWKLPAEDSMDLTSRPGSGLHVVVPQISRIANFDDLDPLSSEPNLRVSFIPAGQPLPADADLVLLPGSKSTIGDLAHLCAQGWDIDIKAHVRRGGAVLGICGGYQMLGQEIADPDGIEGPAQSVPGLGLLNVRTKMTPRKELRMVTGSLAPRGAQGPALTGYEIHIGQTDGPDTERAWITLEDGRMEGATDPSGQVRGCYIHGLFESDAARSKMLKELGGQNSRLNYAQQVEDTLDTLANHLRAHLDIAALLAMARDVDL
ncbi:MAG: cobyric acid synthase [Pseudomonadota bacterium]